MANGSGKIPDALPPPSNCDSCCSINVELTTNDRIYGKLYGEWPFIYYCHDCGAAVGCHCNTHNPLGRMADKETRLLRMQCHNVFDPLWKSGLLSRSAAYKWLASALNIPKEQTHISWLTKENLEVAIVLCKRYYEERKHLIERRKSKREASKLRYNWKVKSHIDARKRH